MAFFYSADPQNPAPPERKQRSSAGIRRGEGHPKALFSESQVRAIKRRIASGEMLSQIARDYAVSGPVIHHIKTGKTWSHVNLED